MNKEAKVPRDDHTGEAGERQDGALHNLTYWRDRNRRNGGKGKKMRPNLPKRQRLDEP